MDENELVVFLERLAPAGFAQILTRIPEATNYVPQGISHLERVSALILYVRSSGGPGLPWLEKTVQELFLDKFLREDDEANDLFSPSIRDHLNTLNQRVERLTEDQKRILRVFRNHNQVRIAGCAGSGKTLVAAHKAVQLSKGMRTLFLCHSPLLADYVRNLTHGSAVDVSSFGAWVSYVVTGQIPGNDSNWTHYTEPDEVSLLQAESILNGQKREEKYGAVIVDEGQDFRKEWWPVVKACLQDQNNGTLYIFYDDLQALLTHRTSSSEYPISDPPYDLSQNCRNAGRIYEIVRQLQPCNPPADVILADKGSVRFSIFEPGEELSAVQESLNMISEMGYEGERILLLGGTQYVDSSPLANATLPMRQSFTWQSAIRYHLQQQTPGTNRTGVISPSDEWIQEQINALSNQPYPTAEDIEVVQTIAKAFKITENQRRFVRELKLVEKLRWDFSGTQLRVMRPVKKLSLWLCEMVMYFERPDWGKGLPQPTRVTLLPYYEPQSHTTVPMYNVAEFKGLEAPCIILLFSGSQSPQLSEHLLVGISRATYHLTLLVDRGVWSLLPKGLKQMFRN